MIDKICNICNENKIGLIAYWFGIRHCEQCDRDIRFYGLKFVDVKGTGSPKGSRHYGCMDHFDISAVIGE